MSLALDFVALQDQRAQSDLWEPVHPSDPEQRPSYQPAAAYFMRKDHVFDQQQHISRETCNPLEGGVDGSGLDRCCANIVSENIISSHQFQQI